jgi:polar amino acid transport system substrate-binding protein
MRIVRAAGHREWLAIVVVAAFALSACASGATTKTSNDIATIVDNILAARVPSEVKSDGVIRVATSPTLAPNEFFGPDGRTVTGFDIDLFDAVASKLGLKAEYVPTKPTDILPGIGSGKYEVGVSSLTVEESYTKLATMVSYYSAGTRWATAKGNPAKVDPDDACGKKVAVRTGSKQHTADVPARQKSCKESSKPALTVDAHPTQEAVVSAVTTGKDDAMIAESPAVDYAVKKSDGKLQTIGDVYGSVPYGYMVGKSQGELAQALVDALKSLISEGTYQRILEKWGVATGAIKAPTIKP